MFIPYGLSFNDVKVMSKSRGIGGTGEHRGMKQPLFGGFRNWRTAGLLNGSSYNKSMRISKSLYLKAFLVVEPFKVPTNRASDVKVMSKSFRCLR